MQHISLGLGGKNKKEKENFYHENVEKVPLCRRYLDVYYANLRERINAIFKRRRRVATIIELATQHSPSLLFFRKKMKNKLLKFPSFRHIIVKL